MSKYLGATPFRELLSPSIATDPTMAAAADALDGVLDATTRAIPNVLLYSRLACDCGMANPVPQPVAMLAPLERLAALSGGLVELPEPVLDLLAWQLHVEGYEAAVDVRAKREMVQASLLLHRRRGTPWAVRHALETALHLPTTVREWPEYGGHPFCFRVGLEVSQSAFGPDTVADAYRLIFEHKNVRSWLDWIATSTTLTLTTSIAIGVRHHTSAHIRLYWEPSFEASVQVYIGIGVRHITRSRAQMYYPPQAAPDEHRHHGMCLSGVTISLLSLSASRHAD